MNYKNMAKAIVEAVGGDKNIKSVVHCATRLRFELFDNKLADEKKLEEIEGVQGVVFRTSQLQLIIGQGAVDECYKEVNELISLKEHSNGTKSKREFNIRSLLDIFLDTISSIFAPIIPAIVGSGMIMGVLYSLQVLEWVDPASGIFQLLNVFSNAAFYFLPMYLAFSSGKRFGCNPYVAAVLGAILIHPTFIGMVSAGTPIIDLGLFEITLQNYSSSVVPIIISVYFMSLIEKGLKRIVPKMVDIIVTPTLSLLIGGVVALWILGPLGQFAGNFVAEGFVWIYNQFGVLGGLFYGLTYPFILATGMQVAFTPIVVMNLESLGYDFMYPFSAASNAAMAAAALYVFFKTRDQDLKSIAGSTGISGLIGVTEPVLFGLVLKFKKVLFAVMAGGAAGGAIMGLFSVTYGGFGFVPFGTIILAFGPTFVYYMLGVSVSMIVTVVILHFTGYTTKLSGEYILNSPVKGNVISLSQVNDPTFAQGYLGNGIAVIPEDNIIYAPCNGKIVSLYHTKHAIGILSDDNVEILIHIGIDTVKMDGEGFISFVNEGDYIEASDKLVEFDTQLIKEKGFDPTVCMVITDSKNYTFQFSKTDGTTDNKDNLVYLSTKENA
ncbi:glucose PTS transporter subunit IIA [Breznakia pachnodae]|uniref:Glucose-specific phosphotransferase system IIA component n=1 Tax=Breznakia pachnodae TaxID=265178 RepID=A0ABU0DY50_9FIRM|nr:glucose PTS transporter subunit IIA [Breznakia pachnodae]MDQ0359557.1 glucose-specific phosphotransferase system IIA component [Breznakia pachnodae]